MKLKNKFKLILAFAFFNQFVLAQTDTVTIICGESISIFKPHYIIDGLLLSKDKTASLSFTKSQIKIVKKMSKKNREIVSKNNFQIIDVLEIKTKIPVLLNQNLLINTESKWNELSKINESDILHIENIKDLDFLKDFGKKGKNGIIKILIKSK